MFLKKETSNLIKLANSAIDNYQLEFGELDKFSDDVKKIADNFIKKNMPYFSYFWTIQGDTHGLAWDKVRFLYIADECEPLHLLGASAHIRNMCMNRFEEFLSSFAEGKEEYE